MEITLKHRKIVKLGHAYYIHIPKAVLATDLLLPEKTYTVKFEMEEETGDNDSIIKPN